MKVAFYIRVNGAIYTSENKPNGAIYESYKKQEELLKEYAGANGYEVVKIYRDLFKGCGTERPALKRMYRDANNFEKIIVADASRISRDFIKYTTIVNNFEDLGVSVEPVRGNTAQEKLMYNIVTAVNEKITHDLMSSIKEKYHLIPKRQ